MEQEPMTSLAYLMSEIDKREAHRAVFMHLFRCSTELKEQIGENDRYEIFEAILKSPSDITRENLESLCRCYSVDLDEVVFSEKPYKEACQYVFGNPPVDDFVVVHYDGMWVVRDSSYVSEMTSLAMKSVFTYAIEERVPLHEFLAMLVKWAEEEVSYYNTERMTDFYKRTVKADLHEAPDISVGGITVSAYKVWESCISEEELRVQVNDYIDNKVRERM